ncbi:MAG: hypothetical protein ACE5II_00755 [Anaerolineae bacterium]
MVKKVYTLVGVIVAIAVVGIATVFIALPALQQHVHEYDIVLVDYGYNKAGFGPTLTTHAGHLTRIKLSNEGAETHELMIVQDKEMTLMMMKNMVQNIEGNESLTTDEQKLAMYNMMHDDMDMAFEGIEMELDPDESGVLEFTIDEPGTYWFVCHNAGGTWPEIHQERGMFGKLIVEA